MCDSWHKIFPKEEIIQLLSDQVRPKNADAVKPLEINPEVHLTKTDRQNERDLRYLSNALSGAGKCVAYLLDMCANAEATLRNEYPEDEGWGVMDDFTFDFPKANRLLVNVAKLLGMASMQTGQAWRAKLQYKFKPEYKTLCDRNQPFIDGKFFGPSFNATAALVTDSNKLQQQTFNSPKKGRGRGR